MAERTEYAPGTPMWVDIGTDTDAAKTFYTGLFGWETQDAGPVEETGGYGFFTKGGKLIAGYGPQQNPGPPFWSTYLAVEDADLTTKKIESAGGTVVVPPMDVMDAGRMAVYQDPEGVFFSVWQPGTHKGAQLFGEPGAFCWAELNTRDRAKAIAFYTDVFGWGEKTSDGPMQYTEFKVGDDSVAGMMELPAEVPAEVPPHWLVYFAVESVDAATAKAQELGGEVLAAPMDIPTTTNRFSVVRDPQGAVIGLFQ